jgi:hypothetical protein
MAKKIRIGRYRVSLLQLIAACGTTLVVVGAVLFLVIGQRLAAISKARDWTAIGAPCPTLSVAAYQASGNRIAHVIDYDGVSLGRGYGYVNCDEIADDGGRGRGVIPICQFNSPTILQVTTKRGRFYYFTQSSPATISIVDGVPRCVMATTMGIG